MGRMHRAGAFLNEQVIAILSCNRSKRDRRVGRTEGRGANLRDRGIADFRHDCQRIDVGCFTLIGAHAGCGIALQMLDR